MTTQPSVDYDPPLGPAEVTLLAENDQATSGAKELLEIIPMEVRGRFGLQLIELSKAQQRTLAMLPGPPPGQMILNYMTTLLASLKFREFMLEGRWFKDAPPITELRR